MSSSTPDITSSALSALRSTLLNTQGTVPLAHRFRALFTLKSLGKSTAHVEPSNVPVSDAAIHIIAEGFTDPSVLLKHELAYVLGQMENPHAVPVLEQVLGDVQQEAMVRHEVSTASFPFRYWASTSLTGCGSPRRALVHGLRAPA